MNWVLGVIGALLGAGLAESTPLLGAVLGFCVLFLIGGTSRLRSRLDAVEKELTIARAQFAAQAVRAATAARAAPVTAETAASDLPPLREPFVAVVPSEAAFDMKGVPEVPARACESTEDPSTGVEDVQATVGSTSSPPPFAPPFAARNDEVESEPALRGAHELGLAERLVEVVKRWFTEGNVPVKVGVLVLFVGIAAALRFAVAQGYFHVPIEFRLAMIGAGGVVGLMFGWRERERRPAFGLSLQGGALGVLLMTVFAAYKMYSLLPPTAAFALVVVLVAGSALLAVLQDAIALAALGFLGGYLAPVLISTGSHDHVALFSYYAVLNAAVFGVSWKRSWRLLNLIGFAFTFGVGTAWGSQFYRPELFATVEPFLILFFVFYVVIGLLYVIRQTEHRRPWVDGTLVFGTPLLAFPLQAGLLKDDRMALAMSALVVAIVYFGLVWYLRRRRDERLLTEAYAALALCFATLAIPLAFSAGTTASVWALEGAGVAWLGIRQNRTFPWLAGLALQLLAAGAYVAGQFDASTSSRMLLLNPVWLGAALVAVGGYTLNFVHDRWRPIRILPAVLFVWATLWWLAAGFMQLDLANVLGIGEWHFFMEYMAGTIALAAILRGWLPWPRLGRLIVICASLVLVATFATEPDRTAPLMPLNLGVWAAYALAMVYALWSTRTDSGSRSMATTHVLGLWTLVFATSMQAGHMARVWQLANGWEDALSTAPLVLVALALWRKPGLFAWPRAELFAGYRKGWSVPATLLLAFVFLMGLIAEGASEPLPYVPLLNPLELSLVAVLALLYGQCEGSLRELRKGWPYAGFALITSATLRAVHHWHGEPWSGQIFDSGESQMALTLVWSLLGVSAWIAGSKRANRRLWMGGAVLMGVVLLKLIALDRHYMGDMQGIASFVVVGLLMVGVGYIAPSPPKQADEDVAEGSAAQDKVEPT